MYPNLSIANNVYPKHLSSQFCIIYKDMYEQRKVFPKGSAENGMLKLALNGTYGKSNDKYSVFYDPQFTMTITCNGQLSLLLLAEKLMQIEGLRLIQLNTDGVTCAFPRSAELQYQDICKAWEEQVKLDLEFADYKAMYIHSVNSYIALYTNGKTKRKGFYEYQNLGWHQNQSSLIIPMAAEAQMTQGIPLEDFIRSHLAKDPEKNIFDFMLRTKVPRNSKLILEMQDGMEFEQQNICRYYPCKTGGKLFKIMPALQGKEESGDRKFAIESNWYVKTCNDMKDAVDFAMEVDYDYYITEAKKLIVGSVEAKEALQNAGSSVDEDAESD